MLAVRRYRVYSLVCQVEPHLVWTYVRRDYRSAATKPLLSLQWQRTPPISKKNTNIQKLESRLTANADTLAQGVLEYHSCNDQPLQGGQVASAPLRRQFVRCVARGDINGYAKCEIRHWDICVSRSSVWTYRRNMLPIVQFMCLLAITCLVMVAPGSIHWGQSNTWSTASRFEEGDHMHLQGLLRSGYNGSMLCMFRSVEADWRLAFSSRWSFT